MPAILPYNFVYVFPWYLSLHCNHLYLMDCVKIVVEMAYVMSQIGAMPIKALVWLDKMEVVIICLWGRYLGRRAHNLLWIGMRVMEYASHLVGEQSGAEKRKVSGPSGLIVPYAAQGDYICIHITKAWKLHAQLGNPNNSSSWWWRPCILSESQLYIYDNISYDHAIAHRMAIHEGHIQQNNQQNNPLNYAIISLLQNIHPASHPAVWLYQQAFKLTIIFLSDHLSFWSTMLNLTLLWSNFWLGNSTGCPGVFFNNPHLHLPIPTPVSMGAGFSCPWVRVFPRV